MSKRKGVTLDALIVATAKESGATDILTADPNDIALLAGGDINVIAL